VCIKGHEKGFLIFFVVFVWTHLFFFWRSFASSTSQTVLAPAAHMQMTYTFFFLSLFFIDRPTPPLILTTQKVSGTSPLVCAAPPPKKSSSNFNKILFYFILFFKIYFHPISRCKVKRENQIQRW
jgi:hypothetical protein